jgi:hypothetical protein
MNDQSKEKIADEIRQIVGSLNDKIKEAYQYQIVVAVSQSSGFYSDLYGKPELVTVEIREEHVL